MSERADRLSMYATLLDDPDEINRELGRYLAVTADDVLAACAELLVPDNRVVLTYVPAEARAAGPGGSAGDDAARTSPSARDEEGAA